MKLHARWIFALTCALPLSFPATAGELTEADDGTIEWHAGIDGVVIEWGEDGEFSRIYSGYTQPVTIPNTRGVRTAKTIAEEKAKAAIVRYLEQTVVSQTLTTEVTADVESASAASVNGGTVQHSSSATSTMLSSLGEFTSSYAKGTLRGVIRLEEGYDQSTGEAWVKVGFSNKTMRAARSVRDAIANDGREPPSASASSGDSRTPSSHVRKTEQKDW